VDLSDTDDTTATRRGLLAKAAVAAPLVAVGSAMVPLSRFMPSAWGAGTSDYDLIGWATTVELAIANLYQTAAGKVSGQQQAVVQAFAGHHTQYAAAFAGFFDAASATAPTAPNPKLLADFAGPVAAGGNGTLTALAQLEELAAASWYWVLGQFENAAGSRTFAAILAVEAQHAVTLGLMTGGKPADLVPATQTDAKKITPSDHPAPAASTNS
jgi:hypothetical protein